MPFTEGNKNHGSRKGIPNKRTKQWNLFAEQAMNGGLEKFEQEMNKLEGEQYVQIFIKLLEFFKPRLSRMGFSSEHESLSEFIEKMYGEKTEVL